MGGYSHMGIPWMLAQAAVTRPCPVKVNDSRIELAQQKKPKPKPTNQNPHAYQ